MPGKIAARRVARREYPPAFRFINLVALSDGREPQGHRCFKSVGIDKRSISRRQRLFGQSPVVKKVTGPEKQFSEPSVMKIDT
ncbi:hypothetical protein ACVDG8_007710 [Mesorhizobium sp. ORM8.1]